VAEGGGLLNRYRGLNSYRGFESLLLRHNFRSEGHSCHTFSTDFVENRVVFFSAESKPATKLIGQPAFGNSTGPDRSIQQYVKGAIVPFYYLEDLRPRVPE
jgi:hypothetical protein